MLKRKVIVDRPDDHGAPDARRAGTLDTHARELVLHLDHIMRRLMFSEESPAPEEPLSPREIGVVDTLGATGSMMMGDLARRLRLPLSTGTRIVDGLVTRDLVQRERPEENRRVVRVALTPKGHAFYQAALAARVTAARAMLKSLHREERHELLRLFRKIAIAVAGEPAR